MGVSVRRCVVLITLGVAALAGPRTLEAQTYQVLGPNKCTNCHKAEKQWWETKDGPPPTGHINALNRMEHRRTLDFAKAIGLVDPYDPNGACVRCHATVFKGEANAGVSCESCHGPGSGYVDIHQEKGGYEKSLAVGMFDTVGKPAVWAPMCSNCHVMNDARLVKAGHPSGDDFDLGAKFAVVAQHWNSRYERGVVASAAKSAAAALIAKRSGAPDPAPSAPPAFVAPSQPAVAPPQPPRAATPMAPSTVQPPPTPPPAGLPRAPTTPDMRAPSLFTRSPAAIVAEVQGRAILLLDMLLRSGASAPIRVKPPEPPTLYRGADAELLLLQEEVLKLAIEALGSAPRAGNQPKRD